MIIQASLENFHDFPAEFSENFPIIIRKFFKKLGNFSRFCYFTTLNKILLNAGMS